MTRLEALTELRDKVKAKSERLRENARTCGKEGKGTHRNAGDAGRVASLWLEALAELKRLEALIAQEQSK
jgi:hypothetical protein